MISYVNCGIFLIIACQGILLVREDSADFNLLLLRADGQKKCPSLPKTRERLEEKGGKARIKEMDSYWLFTVFIVEGIRKYEHRFRLIGERKHAKIYEIKFTIGRNEKR